MYGGTADGSKLDPAKQNEILNVSKVVTAAVAAMAKLDVNTAVDAAQVAIIDNMMSSRTRALMNKAYGYVGKSANQLDAAEVRQTIVELNIAAQDPNLTSQERMWLHNAAFNAYSAAAEVGVLKPTDIGLVYNAVIDSWSFSGGGALGKAPNPRGQSEILPTTTGSRTAVGKVTIQSGANPDANETRAAQGLAIQFGYDVEHQPTASSMGVQGRRTADLSVSGMGQVDVYTPTTTNPTQITRAIEKKYDQATAVIVQTSISDVDMASVASRTFGKPTAQSIQTIFFQRSDGTIVRFDRPRP